MQDEWSHSGILLTFRSFFTPYLKDISTKYEYATPLINVKLT